MEVPEASEIGIVALMSAGLVCVVGVAEIKRCKAMLKSPPSLKSRSVVVGAYVGEEPILIHR
jgi:hypothetical protein